MGWVPRKVRDALESVERVELQSQELLDKAREQLDSTDELVESMAALRDEIASIATLIRAICTWTSEEDPWGGSDEG